MVEEGNEQAQKDTILRTASRRIAGALAAEGVSDVQAVLEIADMLTSEVTVLNDGNWFHRELGTSAEEIAKSYMSDRGSYLRTTARGNGGGDAPNPHAEMEKAMRDPAYQAEWKQRDPRGYDAAWKAYLASRFESSKVTRVGRGY